MFTAAIKEARKYARETTRDAHLIVSWVMEFDTMSSYGGRQCLRRALLEAIKNERDNPPMFEILEFCMGGPTFICGGPLPRHLAQDMAAEMRGDANRRYGADDRPMYTIKQVKEA